MTAFEIDRPIPIKIQLNKLGRVGDKLSLRGETAGGWYFVGGELSGAVFRAIEMTGGTARNPDAPHQMLVSTGVFAQFGLSRLPTSLGRCKQLALAYERLELGIAGQIASHFKRGETP